MKAGSRILVVAGRYPWPLLRGDGKRLVQISTFLAESHDVRLLVPEPGRRHRSPEEVALPFEVATYRVSRWAQVRSAFRSVRRTLPLQAGLFRQPDLQRRLREMAPAFDAVVLQLVRLADHLEDVGPVPVVVDLVDSLALNFRQRSRFDRWLGPVWEWESRALLEAERTLLSKARAGLVVCERDRSWLQRRLPPEATRHLSVVPMQVAEEEPAPPLPPREPNRIVFTGNLGYFPNYEAVRWWLAHVWPVLRRQRPELVMRVAGARPDSRVRWAVRRSGAVLDPSPKDLGRVLASAAVAVAPLRAGSGVPMKVLEAWACGVPVVASPWAAEGAAGRDGTDLLVARTPEDWCRQVLRILDDGALARRLVAGGRARLAERHSPAAVREALARALADLP